MAARGANNGHNTEINDHSYSFVTNWRDEGLQHLGENSWSRRRPKGQTNEFKESRVPLKSKILVLVQMYRYRKVRIFKIHCSKEFRTRQKVK